jgi:hypothetical protein
MQAVLHSREGNRQHHTACDNPPPLTLRRHKDLWTRGLGESELPYNEKDQIHFKWVRTQVGEPYDRDSNSIAIYQEISAEEAEEIRKKSYADREAIRVAIEAKKMADAKAAIDAIVAAHKLKNGYGADVEEKMVELGPKNKPYSYEKPENYLDRLLMYAKRELENKKTWNEWANSGTIISDGANQPQVGYPSYGYATIALPREKVQQEKAKVKEVPIPEPVEPKRRWMRK